MAFLVHGVGPSVTRATNLEKEAENLLFDISGFVNVDKQFKRKTRYSLDPMLSICEEV